MHEISNNHFDVQFINDINSEQLQLIIRQQQKNDLLISVSDVTGKIMLRKSIDNVSNGQAGEDLQVSIDVSTMASGVYFISVESNEKKITGKFFVK